MNNSSRDACLSEAITYDLMKKKNADKQNQIKNVSVISDFCN